MSLSTFIRDHHEAIISEFAIFAQTLMPPGAVMTQTELRDHAADILTALVEDVHAPQSRREQTRKSQGRGSAQAMGPSGRLHADGRIQHGFTLRSVLAEFRALRHTVLRLYEASGDCEFAEIRRFNEAIDEALAVSVDRFSVQTDVFRDQFIGVLSHDLRDPLGAITSGLALLAIPEDNPPRRARVVSIMLSSAQRMQRMIGDLLDLTRARFGGAISIRPRSTDLQQVSEEAVAEIRTSRPEALVRLHATGDLRGDWDAERLSQVVSNLVGNAVQHGEGTEVTLTLADDGDAVTLAVHNGGAPIPVEVMPSIFEPLARGGREGATHSIGLGLFIARAIVSAHGGEIGVTSSAEDGTTFTARLPR